MQFKLTNRKTHAIVAAVGFVAGAAVAVVVITKTGHLLKTAKWSPQGDMMLQFYNRTNWILCPNPLVK